VLVPAGTPKAVVDLLHGEIGRIVSLPEVKARLDTLGFVPIGNTPDEFAKVIKDETARWGKVIRDAKLRVE
jgi:tripartite-type tricarboxylate transporter receptor subunit TctC